MIARALAAWLAAAALAAGAAEPVAFVADLQGNANIAGQGKASFLAELVPGARLLLGTGATVAVTFAATGTEFTLNGPGEFVVAATEVKAERGPAPRKRTVGATADPAVIARASRTANASLRMRGINPRAAPAIALQYPVDTRVVTLQPTLRWRGDAAGEPFAVTLTDADGKPVWHGQVKPAMARPPVKLAASTAYRWTVMTSAGARAEGRFETLSPEAVARAEKARAGARTFPGRVLHAFVLQDIGATQDAREAWAALARERPDLPELEALAR